MLANPFVRGIGNGSLGRIVCSHHRVVPKNKGGVWLRPRDPSTARFDAKPPNLARLDKTEYKGPDSSDENGVITGNSPYSVSPYWSVWRGGTEVVGQSGAGRQLAATVWCVLACDGLL